MKSSTLSLLARLALFVIVISFAINHRTAQAGEIGQAAITGATADRSGQELSIKVIVHKDAQELRDTRAEILRGVRAVQPVNSGTSENSDADGFSVIRGNQCEIHVLPIKHANDRERMRLWGHELAHCVYGTYHK